MTPKEKSKIESDIPHNDSSPWGIWTTGIESVDGGLFAAAKHTGDRLTLILRGFDVENFEAIAEFEATLFFSEAVTKVFSGTGAWGDSDFVEIHYVRGKL